jgi:hypothetical protein
MLTTIQDNYMMSTIANGTRAYREEEEQRQGKDFKSYVRDRDQAFQSADRT